MVSVTNKIDAERLAAIAKAMQDSDHWVIRVQYVDASGVRTSRVISPIRFGKARQLVALCLCRMEPRTFKLDQVEQVQLMHAEDVLAPEEITVIEG